MYISHDAAVLISPTLSFPLAKVKFRLYGERKLREMKPNRVVIHVDTEDCFNKVKKECDELALTSYPDSHEHSKDFELKMEDFIATNAEYTTLYIIDLCPDTVIENMNFYKKFARGQKTIFLFGIKKKKEVNLDQVKEWCRKHPECCYVDKNQTGMGGFFTADLFFTLLKILKPKEGKFRSHWEPLTGNGPDTCEDCFSNNIPHQIIDVPIPAIECKHPMYRSSMGAHKRECTGCQAQDGPWIPAQC
jgi:hypothetical protein